MPDNLTFNVAQLLKESVGATRAGEVRADLRDLAPELEQITAAEGEPASPLPQGEGPEQRSLLVGPVRLMNTDGGILVQGHLTAQAVLACARCLEPVVVPLEVDIEDIFLPTVDVLTGQLVTPEDEDRALWIDAHHILDLREVLRQDVLVAAPVRVLCRDDCRGLCPTCGQNLNLGPCDCRPEPDARWAALTALLKDSE